MYGIRLVAQQDRVIGPHAMRFPSLVFGGGIHIALDISAVFTEDTGEPVGVSARAAGTPPADGHMLYHTIAKMRLVDPYGEIERCAHGSVVPNLPPEGGRNLIIWIRPPMSLCVAGAGRALASLTAHRASRNLSGRRTP
jgi:hypothetical protein